VQLWRSQARQNRSVQVSERRGRRQSDQRLKRFIFSILGKTTLSVRGMFSRRIYRFAASMAVLEVEGRDAPGLAAVPLLKRVSAPD
jgi:hypothetical protein